MPNPLLSIFRTRRAQLAALTLAHLLVDMYAGLVQPLIPELRERVGVRLSVMTAVIGVSHIVVNAVQPFAGLIAARLRRPLLMLIGPALAMTLALLGEPESLWTLAVLLIVAHVGIGMFHPDGLMAAHAVSGSKGHLAMPIFLSGGYLGYSLGAVVSTQWLYHFGFDRFWWLMAPGWVLIGVLFLAGLHKPIRRDIAGPSASGPRQGTHFAALMALSVLSVTMTCVVFMFFRVDLKDRWGDSGGVYGGQALAVFGLAGVTASYVWGLLSVRFSRFALMAFGHVACAPLMLMTLRAQTGTELLLWCIPTGATLGTSLFPLIVTAARDAPQLNPNLRAGLIIGGTWGGGSMIAMGCGWLTDFGVRPDQFMPFTIIPTLAAAMLAGYLYVAERRQM